MKPSTFLTFATIAFSVGVSAVAPWTDPEAPQSMRSAPAQFQLYKLPENNTFGAVALDGSPAAFYFHEGASDNWAIYFQLVAHTTYAPAVTRTQPTRP